MQAGTSGGQCLGHGCSGGRHGYNPEGGYNGSEMAQTIAVFIILTCILCVCFAVCASASQQRQRDPCRSSTRPPWRCLGFGTGLALSAGGGLLSGMLLEEGISGSWHHGGGGDSGGGGGWGGGCSDFGGCIAADFGGGDRPRRRSSAAHAGWALPHSEPMAAARRGAGARQGPRAAHEPARPHPVSG